MKHLIRGGASLLATTLWVGVAHADTCTYDGSVPAYVGCIADQAWSALELALSLDDRVRTVERRSDIIQLPHEFCGLLEPAMIPDSDGALICALTMVDDNTNDAKCEIWQEDSHWVATTRSSDCAEAACKVSCLHSGE